MKQLIPYQAVIIVASMLSLVVGAPFDLSWNNIDSGGAMRSSGGAFVLSGTIGQPDAGTMSGGSFKMAGGFWFETPPGDCNADGAVGLLDHMLFVNCLSGPVNDVEPGCECFDVNLSGAIDLADFSENQVNLIGL